MMSDLSKLVTESRLPESMEIDRVSTEQMLQIINAQDQLVALAVQREIPQIARAVDLIAGAMKLGGRLFYVGAGTSGRLGVLDASEIPPTYGAPQNLVQGVIAGGWRAVFETQEGVEDDGPLGAREIAERVKPGDAVVGIAASGRTPYTVAAVAEARRLGCVTVGVTNNPGSGLEQVADVVIAPVVGPEVVMGSTRMKAGTSQKLVLNMLSTGVMIRLGKVYSNLMADMHASNEKLRHRAVRMVSLAAGVDEEVARAVLEDCGGHAKTAIVALLTGADPQTAFAALERAGGYVHAAVAQVKEAGR